MPEYNISITVTGQDKGATGMLQGVGGGLQRMRDIAGGIIGAKVIEKIASSIFSLGRRAIESTANIQAMTLGLESLLAKELALAGGFDSISAALPQAQQLAAGLMDELERMAIISPYQFETVTNTFRLGMAFGWSSTQAKMFTKAVLNVAAGTGATNEMLGRMSYNFAQIRMQGKVTAMDIRQLAQAGFDLLGVLRFTGKQLGINIQDHLDFNKAIKSGKITWEDFIQSFEEYAETNFAGASERMARSLKGLGSTIKEVFEVTFPKILGPAAEHFTEFAGSFLDSLLMISESGVLSEIGETLGERMDLWLEPARNFSEKFQKFIQMGLGGMVDGEYFAGGNWGKAFARMFGDTDFAAILEGLAPIRDAFMGMVQPLADIAREYAPQFLDHFAEVGRTVAANVGPLLIKVFNNLGQWFTQNQDKIRNIVGEFLELKQAIWDFAVIVAEWLGPVLQTLWEEVVGPFFSNFLDVASELLDFLINVFQGDWESAWESLGEILTSFDTMLKDLFIGIGEWLQEIFISEQMMMFLESWSTLWNELLLKASNFAESIPGIFGGIAEFLINSLVSGPYQAASTQMEIWLGTIRVKWILFKIRINRIITSIRDWFGARMADMNTAITNVYNEVTNLITKLIELRDWAKTNVITIVANLVGGGWGAIGNWAASRVTGDQRQFGGSVFSDRDYLIGENGPEVVRFNSPGRVLSGYEVAAMDREESPGSVINIDTIEIHTKRLDADELIETLNTLQREYSYG